jgi:hypothetical protein
LSQVAADIGRDPRLSRRIGQLARRGAALAAWGLAAFLILEAVGAAAAAATPSEPAKSVALLNVQFLNDHEDLEPTTAALLSTAPA